MAARVAGLVCSLVAGGVGAQDGAGALPDGFFADEIAPLLRERCWTCHGGERLKSGLSLADRPGLLAGGESGPAIHLDDPEQSTLLRMVRYEDEDHRMPPDGKLADADVARLERWVRAGAPWDGAPLGEPVAEEHSGPRVPPRGDGREGWGWVPPRRVQPPRSSAGEHPVDAFIRARLAERELTPAPPADARTLLRRLSFDLTGLPPTPERLAAFEADPSPAAYGAEVERLLASPEHGQRWARHWLDVVRYAETNGFERDGDKPLIWRYRDWVVDALNRDLPYDDFVRLQLAADEYADTDTADLVATAYYRLGQWDDEPGEGALVGRYDVFDDIVNTTAQSLLAMNIGCARCHDHPADPVPQADYYRFVGLVHGLTDMSNSGYVADVASDAERAARAAAEGRRAADGLAWRHQALGVERALAAQVAADDGTPARHPGLTDVRWTVAPPRADAERAAGSPGPGDARAWLERAAVEPWPQGGDRLEATPAGFEPTPEALAGLFVIDPAARARPHVLVGRAQLDVPSDGLHAFRAGGPERTWLWIDDQLVVDARGEPVEGRVQLSAGAHELLVVAEADTARGLTLQWDPRPVQLVRLSFSRPEEDGWERPETDAGYWARGLSGIGSAGIPGGRVRREWSSREVWVRERFDWSGDPDAAVLLAHHDEDLQVWVDGELAASASGFRTDYGILHLERAARDRLETAGEHLLAQHCGNTEGAQYVHVAVVPRAALIGSTRADAAFGWQTLSADVPWMDTQGGPLAGLDEGRLSEAQQALRAEALSEHRAVEARPLPPVRMPMVQEIADVPPVHVHVRGNPRVPGEEVQPGFPGCLAPPAFEPAEVPDGVVSSGRRRALAEWVTDDEHALAARVMVNRVWQHHFGRGLVGTPNDFGELGQRPSHPELLDWLARWFVDEAEWSLRALHRLLVSSETYRQSGHADARSLDADPDAVWLSRFPRRRLGAEELRDSVLALAGTLDTRLGGRPVFEPVSQAVLATSSKPHEVWGESAPEEVVRRSLYIKSKRSLTPPLHTAFDGADSSLSCPVRFETTAPTQALTLLNGTFVQRVLPDLAARVAAAADDLPGRVAFAHELAWGRPAEPDAVAADVDWLHELQREYGLDERGALGDLCLMLVNSNAFVYVD